MYDNERLNLQGRPAAEKSFKEITSVASKIDTNRKTFLSYGIPFCFPPLTLSESPFNSWKTKSS
jgi:hypothetical protein